MMYHPYKPSSIKFSPFSIIDVPGNDMVEDQGQGGQKVNDDVTDNDIVASLIAYFPLAIHACFY